MSETRYQTHLKNIARSVYERGLDRAAVPAVVDDYGRSARGFHAIYMTMSERALKRFENAVWKRVEYLGGLDV